MESDKPAKPAEVRNTFSRRNLLRGAATLTTAGAASKAFAQAPTRPGPITSAPTPTGAPFGTVWVYIGTYTPNGQGIYLGSLNLTTGKLSILRLVAPALTAMGSNAATTSPSTLAIDQGGNFLYAGNEFGPPGAVSAYRINRRTGDLMFLNAVPAVGAPAHVSVDLLGRYLFAAEYSGFAFEVFPINGNGSLGPAAQTILDIDNVGPKTASSAPPGSFAISAHEGPNGHPHQLEADPSNQWVVGSDAGQDRIYVWKLNSGGTLPLTPALTPTQPLGFVNVPPGDGPRHFAFHPNGRWMYSIQEEGDTIIFWSFDPATGSLTKQATVSSLPPDFAGTVFTSEIRVSDDGRFVYGVNRLSDTIGVFSIGGGGYLTRVSHTSTLGDYPRIITTDPSGRYMASGNQRADNITTFRINRNTGGLTFTGFYTPVGSPSAIVFLN